jgi:anti-anti-sigma factor
MPAMYRWGKEMESAPIRKELLFEVEGDLDVNNVHRLLALKMIASDKHNDPASCKHVLDMKNVRNIDSSGIGILVHIKAEIDKKGGQVILINLNDQVSSLFHATTMDDYFNIA